MAEFLDWRTNEEKRHRDYLVRVPLAFRQPKGVLGHPPPPPNPSSRNTWDHLCNASQHPAKPQTGLEPPARIPGRFGERCLRVQLLIIPALKRFIFMVLLVFIPDQVLKGHSLMWN